MPRADTYGMRGHTVESRGVVAIIASLLLAAAAEAGNVFHCPTCGPGAGGSPYGNTGCGRRYCGEKHEPSCPDPCDACARWRGCNGATQGPDMLAPWQLPPGRGFMTAEQVGYDTRPSCQRCEYQFRVR
jgi:hypothetical protein